MRRIQLGIAALATAAMLGSGGAATAAKEKFERTKPHVNVGTISPAEDAGKTVANPTPAEGGADAEATGAAERRVPERLRHRSREGSDAATQGVEVRGWDPKKKEELVGEASEGGAQLKPGEFHIDQPVKRKGPDTGK